MESCLSAEEVYLLDKRTSTETASFVRLRGYCTVVAEIGALLRLEKKMQYFNCRITVSLSELFTTALAAQNIRGQRAELLGSRLKHTPEREREFCSSAYINDGTPYGHPLAAPQRMQPHRKTKTSLPGSARSLIGFISSQRGPILGLRAPRMDRTASAAFSAKGPSAWGSTQKVVPLPFENPACAPGYLYVLVHTFLF